MRSVNGVANGLDKPRNPDSVVVQPSGCAIDIVIPVYRGLETTRLCIESVLASPLHTTCELVVVDDACPEPALSTYLDTLAAHGRITLLRNKQNVGFVESANRGMRHHPDRDVVLLNSDTEVANDWLDRLRACAYRDPRIATVTPFSNNATICSYPIFCAENALPDGVDVATLDDVFRRVNAGKSLEIPTAVGFCMYIRRTCLNELGLFDAERFGRGYGEENDFSRRAVRAGWRNVLCGDVFVFHAGGVSFQAERESLVVRADAVLRKLHPGYFDEVRRFIRQDPVAPLRRAVEIGRARERLYGGSGALEATPREVGAETGCDARAVQLHVVHDLGGGIQRWYEDFCRADTTRRNLILKPFCHGPIFGSGLMLFADAKAVRPIGFWRFEEGIDVTAVFHSEYKSVLEEIVLNHGVDAILVSSLIGHSLDVLDTGLPTVVVLHDFFPLCPAINLYFDGVCTHCDDGRLTDCVEGNPDFNPFKSFPAEQRIAVRQHYLECLCAKNVAVVAPCRAAWAHMLSIAPVLRKVPIAVIPHGYAADLKVHNPVRREPKDRLRIMVLGMLSVSKGVRILEAALPQLTQFADIYLVGAKEVGERFLEQTGVHVLDEYAIDDLSGIVEDIGPHAGLLLSIWPETFSYTLSELFLLGVPPVATRLGGFADRIIEGETGFLVDPDAASLVASLRKLDADRTMFDRVRENLRDLPRRCAKEMVADYHSLLPLPVISVGGVPVCRDEWQEKSYAAELDLALKLANDWKRMKSLHLRLDIRAARLKEQTDHLQHLNEELTTCHDNVRVLTREHESLLGRLVFHESQLSEIYASTSWRVSWPVRWLGRRLRQVRILYRGLKALSCRPAGLPSLAKDLSVAWMREGGSGMKRTFLDAAFPEPVSVFPTEEAVPSASVQTPEDWRQERFRRYRETLALQRPTLLASIEDMQKPPLVSVLVPTFNSPETMLREMLDSVCSQLYPHWELCIADDNSTESHVKSILKEYADRDTRIQLDFAEENGGVARATNRALALAEGDFVVLLDHDDVLEEQALFRVAEAVLADAPDMLYSDEVLVGEDGRTVQHFIFRPMFSPEYLRAHPYIVHLIGFRTGFLKELGGLDESLRISQDYDLVLRASERAQRIVHIPEMLYRWRIHGASAGHAMIDEVMETSGGILQRHLQRCGEAGEVTAGASFNFFDVRYPLVPGLKVAIVIPTKNHAELVRACIESIERTAGDVAHEIVLVDHESDDPVALACFDSLRARVTLLRYQGPFNFAAINNWAVARLDGSHTHYLFCNNDVEAIEPGWLRRMLELGQKPDVGVVGAKLYYPGRRTIQHAGVVVACCGVAENLARFREAPDGELDLGYIGSLVCNREVSAVTGACMLVRRDAFEEIGGFDETIAVGYGDVDLCLRAGQRGYRTLFCAHATLLHHESYTRGRMAEDPHPEDSARFLAKWRAMFAAGDPYFNPNLSSHSPNWQVADPLTVRMDVPSRLFVRAHPLVNAKRE